MQLTWIYAQALSEDGTKLLGERKEILRNDATWEGIAVEGSFILRRGGWFYHFYSGNACCGRACNYALGVARSRHLLGPWEKYAHNPVVAANQEWQWPIDSEQSARVEVEGGGHLVLEPLKAQGDAFAAAVVARRTTAGDYVATALVVARGTSGDARAGLAAYGWRESAAGVAVGGGKVTVWRREGRDTRTVASADAPKSEVIYLRMTAEGGE